MLFTPCLTFQWIRHGVGPRALFLFTQWQRPPAASSWEEKNPLGDNEHHFPEGRDVSHRFILKTRKAQQIIAAVSF